MASYGWRKGTSVEQGLFEEGYRFEFFQAVRLLELVLADSQGSAAGPGSSAGPGSAVENGGIRFRSDVSLAFPVSEVAKVVRAPTADDPAEVWVSFMGLAGVNGPMPHVLTERIIERVGRGDTALRDFLDIFNHRLVSMLYRVRQKARVALHRGRPEKATVARPLFALFGLGTAGLRDRMPIAESALLSQAGILSKVSRTMVGLSRMLSNYFGVSVSLKPFVGQWRTFDEDQRTAIGANGRNHALGREAVLGSRFWDQSAGFEIEAGPLTYDEFLSFLPSGDAYTPLCALASFYTGRELDFQLRLRLAEGEMPQARLGSYPGPRLGWTAWLSSAECSKEDSQTVVRGSNGG